MNENDTAWYVGGASVGMMATGVAMKAFPDVTPLFPAGVGVLAFLATLAWFYQREPAARGGFDV